MLSETTSKNAELEQQVKSLEEAIQSLRDQQTRDLQAKDELVSSLQTEVQECKKRENEAKEGWDGLQEEMAALSQAYSSLEEEHRRHRSPVSGEEQTHGEGSNQEAALGSTEVSTLRAALARQREDNKAAEEWMAMAVGKMTEFNNDNAALQQEVAALREQLTQQAPSQEAQLNLELSEVTQQLGQERTRRKELEGELGRQSQTPTDMSVKAGEERTGREAAEKEFERYRTEMQHTFQALEASEAERRDLVGRVQALTAELADVRKNTVAEQIPTTTANVDAEQVSLLQHTVDSLTRELESAKTNLTSSQQREQEEIYRREARIRELESRLSEGLGSYTVDDIRRKDEEIAELRESNDAAQEWMGKAVEHTQSLSEQISSLSQENKALSMQVKDLGDQLQLSQTAPETILKLESELKSRDSEIDRIFGEMAKKESSLQDAIREANVAKSEAAEQKEEIVRLRLKLSEITNDLQNKTNEVDGLRSDVANNVESLKEIQDHNSSILSEAKRQEDVIESLRSDVRSRASRVEELEARVELLEQGSSTLSSLDTSAVRESCQEHLAQIEELKLTVRNLEDQLEEQENDSNDVNAQWEETYAALESRCKNLETELSRKESIPGRSASGDVKEGNRIEEELTVQVESLSRQPGDGEADAATAIDKWKKTCTTVETRLEALTKEREELESTQTQPASETLGDSEEKDHRIAELSSQVESLTQRLQDSGTEATRAIDQWRKSYVDADARLERLTKDYDTLKSKRTFTNAEFSDGDVDARNRIVELSAQVDALTKQLQSTKTEAAGTLEQWQAAYAGNETRRKTVSREREELEEKQASLGHAASARQAAGECDDKDSKIAELASQVENLTRQLQDSESGAANAIEQWQAAYNDIETQLENLTAENEQLKSIQASPGHETDDLRPDMSASRIGGDSEEDGSKIAELTSQVESLTQQLQDSATEAANAIEQWQAAYTGVDAQLKTLTEDYEELKAKHATLGDGTADSGPDVAALQAVAESEDKHSKIAELASRVENLTQQLQDSKSDSVDPIEQWQAAFTDIETQLKKLTAENEQLKSIQAAPGHEADDMSASQVVGDTEDGSKIVELTSQVESLTQQLQDSETEAANAIEQWQAAYTGVDAQLKTLTEDYEELKAKHATLGDETVDSGPDAAALQAVAVSEDKGSKLAELASQVENLTRQLQDSESDSANAIEQWQAAYTDIETQLENLTAENEQLKSIQASPGHETDDLRPDMSASRIGGDSEEDGSKIVELTSQVESLTQQLQDSETEAANAIEQWQAAYTGVDAQLKTLTEDYEELKAKHATLGDETVDSGPDAAALQAVAVSEDKDSKLAELASQVENLTRQLQDSESDSANAIEQWQAAYTDIETQLENLTAENEQLKSIQASPGHETDDLRPDMSASRIVGDSEEDGSKIAELTSQVESLTQQLQDSATEAANAIEQWQAAYTGVDAQLKTLTEDYEELKAKHATLGDETVDSGPDAAALQAVAVSEDKDSKLAELASQVENLTRQLQDSESDSANAIEQWQAAYTDIETQLENLTAENEQLKSIQAAPGHEADDLRPDMSASQVVGDSKEDGGKIVELTSQVESLTQQLQDSETEAANAIEQWQAAYTGVDAQLKTLTEDYEELKAKHATLGDGTADSGPDVAALQAVAESEDKDSKLAELANRVENLTQQLQDSESDSVNAIEQWQAAYTDIETQLKNLTAENEQLKSIQAPPGPETDGVNQDVSASQAVGGSAARTIEQVEESHANIESQLEVLTRENAELKSNEVLLASGIPESPEKDTRIAELQSEIHALTQQLLDGEADAATEIQHWRASNKDLEVRLDTVTKEHEELVLRQKLSDTALAEEIEEKNQLVAKVDELCLQLQEYKDTASNLEGQLQVVEEKLEQKSRESEEISSLASELSRQILRLESSDAAKAKQIAGLTVQVDELRSKLEESRNNLTDSVTAGEELTGRLSQLEEKLRLGEEAISGKVEELSRLRERIKALSTEKNELEEESRTALERLAETRDNFVTEVSRLHSKCSSLERKVDSLEALLKSTHEEKESLVKQLLQTEQSQGSAYIVEESLQETCRSQTARILELENAMKVLEEDLRIQGEEAEAVIAQWASSYETVEAQALDFERQVFDFSQKEEMRASELKEVQKNLEKRSSELKETEEKLSRIKEELETVRANLVLQKDLEAEVETLRDDLKSREAVCEGGAEEDALLREKQARLDAEEQTVSLERKLKETEELFSSRLEASISEHNRTKESLDSQRLLERERLEKLEAELSMSENEKATLTHERDMLKTKVAELVDELQEANDAMQLHVTNEVSDKATELAAEALREEMQELSLQAEADQKECLAERRARHFAEQEVARLRADLAALLGMEDTEENHADIQKRTIEAKGKFQRQEIAEIESLKTALSNALEELTAVRKEEKKANDRAAKSNAEASIYEQELVTAKSDLNFLTETLDEMREAESSKRASLEYRVSSLENDQEVLRQLHRAEMESLQNELHQLSMERDRLFQALKVSEKSKEALVRASGRGELVPGEGALDPRIEVEVLRLEKAELLAAAAEEGSRFEMRLHEALAAQKSSTEADLILEKELRLAAVRALENMRLEVSELKTELSRVDSSSGARETSDTKDEMETLKNENVLLLDEKQALEDRLADWKREADKKMARLVEDCRLAKVRVLQLERDGRYEAEIRAEVSRLQTSSNGNGGNEQVMVDPAEDYGDPEESTKIAKLFDVVQEQNKAIEDERSQYFALKEEHDDLLALLVQHDLVRASLKTGLFRLGGEEAVTTAVREAEEKAIAKFGRVVNLPSFGTT